MKEELPSEQTQDLLEQIVGYAFEYLIVEQDDNMDRTLIDTRDGCINGLLDGEGDNYKTQGYAWTNEPNCEPGKK